MNEPERNINRAKVDKIRYLMDMTMCSKVTRKPNLTPMEQGSMKTSLRGEA